jgi:hypothetical protein
VGTGQLYARSKEWRRIAYLEAVVYLIRQMETFRTKEEADEFFEELQENRRQVWDANGADVTWPKANDPERFAE